MIGQDGLLEYIRTPLTLDSIGGMRHLKKWLEARKDVFNQKAREFGIEAPRGVLMLGVQGSGKSLCAKAIATAWQQPLMRLDPGVLYNKFIGESESNLRKALNQTAMMSPVVLWIDEIEKGFASAASQSTDGGLSKRMFGTLLTWMQEHAEPVFLVATANDIEALPPELLRKGRFDEVFFVDLPGESVRAEIFSIHLEKRRREAKKFDLKRLAKAAEGFSGAEIEQVVINSLHEAFTCDEELTTDVMLRTVSEMRPLSVMMAERVEELRNWAKGRCVMAD
jgi:SpoVK/Ycf46/Vps4 family AAA+-type ATPase